MKNKFIEKYRESAKRYSKTTRADSRWNSKLGLRVYHVYDEPKPLTWWDDVAFLHGSQQITVWFVHPRMAYHDHIDDLVQKSLEPREKVGCIFDEATPNYKFLGKNKKRKKIVSWTMDPIVDRAYFDNWRKTTEEMCNTSDYVQRCSISIQQYSYCRGVELVVPVEIRSEADLVKIKDIVLQHLADPTYFGREFGECQYTSTDWVRENPPKTVDG